MIQFKLFRQITIDHEGIRCKAYQDSEKIWTVGIGHNCENEQHDDELEVFGYEDDLPEDLSTIEITEEQAYALFDIDVHDAIESMPDDFTPEFLQSLGEHRAAALLGMCFQIGSISKWKNLCNAVRNEDWERAANEMLYSNGLTKNRPSLWHTQTPKRCEEAAEAMRTGVFEAYAEKDDSQFEPPRHDHVTRGEFDTLTKSVTNLQKSVSEILETMKNAKKSKW